MVSAQDHHIIPQQRIKQARSQIAVKVKALGDSELTNAEHRLYTTPLTTILADRRNIVRLSHAAHHRAHHFERLRPSQLPAGIHDFAEEYALGWALDHELRLIGVL